MPSLSEGLPMTVLEALSQGMPVIVSPNCNIPEIDLYKAGYIVNLTKTGGRAYIFGLFNPEKLDVLVKIRKSNKNFKNNHWESGWNMWSINTISQYLDKKKINFKFHRWDISKNLPKKKDPLRSYTQKLSNKKYQLITGAQIIYNLHALVIEGKKK